jgi:hypothetical protein
MWNLGTGKGMKVREGECRRRKGEERRNNSSNRGGECDQNICIFGSVIMKPLTLYNYANFKISNAKEGRKKGRAGGRERQKQKERDRKKEPEKKRKKKRKRDVSECIGSHLLLLFFYFP